jgi:hypothetical protein
MKIVNFNQFINENINNDYTELYKNIEFLKQKYNDYKEIQEFFINIDNYLYDSNVTQVEFGFGFCNDTKSSFGPLFDDISYHLINNDFNIDMEQLEKTHKSLYFTNNINKFVKYMKSKEITNKKYYYYKTIKQRTFLQNLYTTEEKIKYIEVYFKSHKLSKKYDININSPVSFIDVKLVEK